jgi:quercetin dioxygenase-like cupin family protein
VSGAAVGLSTARPARAEPIIRIPSLGLGVRVRIASANGAGPPTVLETTNAAGFGPPLHRRAQSEIFEIVTGRFLFEVDGQRFIARRGDLVSVPGGAARAFVNVTGTGARQKVIIQPGIDAAAFFGELAQVLASDARGRSARLRAFGERWRVDYLGAPLDACDALWHGAEP